jgi:hypothetical protein
MSLLLSRNAVASLSFVAFAIAMFFAPAGNVVFSLFLLVMGLALSTMVYVLWHEHRVAVALEAPSLDTARRESTGSR